ncbi:BatD family protein [Roseibium marinum]|uniref:Oxygen tolerance protein BatD n=1 Tax=Roseibium marinum TaxID=281252 RepID=A0A2S3V549_9HYPH|nr:BatD family protein [Roseibium marinum]POF34799.1 oxygen tolerance protein BatD [Roseibium marinum]
MVIRLALLLILLLAPSTGARAESLRLIVPEMLPVVGEMIPVTVRGEYTHRIALETLTFPDSDAYDWMQLARDDWREERVNGRTLLVLERRIALFPRKAGPITIGPLTHHLTIATDTGGREPLDVRTEPVTVQVAAFPADSAPLAASALKVEDTLSALPGALRDGETLIRRVTLSADDTLPHLLPPRPTVRQPWLISFSAPEVREVKPTPQGPETTVIWEWHLRPKTGEPGVLPPVEIPWFDTATRQMRVAQIPAIPFGYASFEANRTRADRLPTSQIATACAVFTAGLLAGLALALAGASPRRKTQILKLLKRWSPHDPTRRALKAAARTKDLIALRSAAERYLARRRDLDLPETGGSTAELDRAIYAAGSGVEGFDPERFRRGLVKGKT